MVSTDMRPEYIQEITLTPQMLLSVHVLQLNVMDLKTFMQAELEENPLLEEEISGEAPDEDEAKISEELSSLIDESAEGDELFPNVERLSNVINEEKRRYLESLVVKKESLYDHLRWQLDVLAKNSEEKRIGEFIIGNIDDNGFLTMKLEKMQEQIKADTENFKHALSLVRSLDPVGIGARNIKESLLIQLISSGKGNTKLYKIVYFHLKDLEKGNYERIANALSIPVEEVKKAKRRISYLNPKPGAALRGGEVVSIITPDIFFFKDNGVYTIEVNDKGLPKLKINPYYKNVLNDKKTSKKTREYIAGKLTNARWLIHAVIRRKQTITAVCEYLAEVQKDFLVEGEEFLKPLTLRRVSDELPFSEATISRVVSNKYAQISDKLLSLKSFFSKGIKTIDGRLITERGIKRKIYDFIKEEDAKRPLSDQRLTTMLKDEGINIARRTVAKYRERLNILPTPLRRKS